MESPWFFIFLYFDFFNVFTFLHCRIRSYLLLYKQSSSTSLPLPPSSGVSLPMEDLVSLWSYQEIIEELQRKLLYATIELESLRMEVKEEIKKNKENVKNLLHLLHLANRERDEARQDIQELMNKLLHIPPSGSDLPAKAHSTITDSNSFFESPADSFFDGVSSPVFSNSSMADSSNLGFARTDSSSAVIDCLSEGKALPPKGKLLQAVTAAGPLLQTLLLTGPLPRWRIPPPKPQLFKTPQASINQKADSKPLNSSSPHLDISRGSSQMCSASI